MIHYVYGYQHNWLSSINYIEAVEFEYYGENKEELYLSSPNLTQSKTTKSQIDKQYIAIKPSFLSKQYDIEPIREY